MARAPVRVAIATDSLARQQGQLTGRPHTPQDWLERTHALAVINGGYFGQETAGGRVEIIGLLVQNGKVVHAATISHAVLAIASDGLPVLIWAVSRRGVVVASDFPEPDGGEGRCHPPQAVGCGPMLIHNGQVVVTDRQEALVSPGALPRTFVALGGSASQQHFVMGMASGSEYRDLARFLRDYFPRYDGLRARDAMCLDGGASTQLTYRTSGGATQSPRFTGVAVPDVVLLLPQTRPLLR